MPPQPPQPPLEPLPPIAQQPLDPLMPPVNYIPPPRMDMDSAMTKHLDASEMLNRLKNTLKGLEYNDDKDEWQTVKIKIIDESGEEIEVDAEPLLPERTVRSLIGSLEMYLSPNTFLSQLKDDDKNDMMFGICQNLAIIWLRIGNRIKPEERAVIHSTIKDAIFLGLSRAGNKITLDAVSKMQQTHEIIQHSPSTQPQPKGDDFKVMGW